MCELPKMRGIKTLHDSALAQLVEQMTVNHWVAGSSPAGGAKSFTMFVQGVPNHDALFAITCRSCSSQRSNHHNADTYVPPDGAPEQALRPQSPYGHCSANWRHIYLLIHSYQLCCLSRFTRDLYWHCSYLRPGHLYRRSG